jgi:hypothetical protein
MSKQYYGVIKLAHHIPAWCDMVNNIHLTRGGRWFKCVTDDMDLKPILKGIKAGLIEWASVEEIGTGVDEGAKLPIVTFQCRCDVEEKGYGVIEEGVLAPYDPSYDEIPGAPEKPEEPEEPGVDPEPEPEPDPKPEKPEAKLNVKIMYNNAEVEEVIIERGLKTIELLAEIEVENCAFTFENLKFDVINIAECLEGCEGVDVQGVQVVDGVLSIDGLVFPKDYHECEVAKVMIYGECGCEEEKHTVEKEVIIKAKECKMFFDDCPIQNVYNPDELEVQGLDFVLAGMDMEVGPIDRMPIDEEDEKPGAFLGWYILFAPEEAGLQFEAWDAVGGDFAIEEPGCIVVNGVSYKVQWLDLTSGKNGIDVQVF